MVVRRSVLITTALGVLLPALVHGAKAPTARRGQSSYQTNNSPVGLIQMGGAGSLAPLGGGTALIQGGKRLTQSGIITINQGAIGRQGDGAVTAQNQVSAQVQFPAAFLRQQGSQRQFKQPTIPIMRVGVSVNGQVQSNNSVQGETGVENRGNLNGKSDQAGNTERSADGTLGQLQETAGEFEDVVGNQGVDAANLGDLKATSDEVFDQKAQRSGQTSDGVPVAEGDLTIRADNGLAADGTVVSEEAAESRVETDAVGTQNRSRRGRRWWGTIAAGFAGLAAISNPGAVFGQDGAAEVVKETAPEAAKQVAEQAAPQAAAAGVGTAAATLGALAFGGLALWLGIHAFKSWRSGSSKVKAIGLTVGTIVAGLAAMLSWNGLLPLVGILSWIPPLAYLGYKVYVTGIPGVSSMGTPGVTTRSKIFWLALAGLFTAAAISSFFISPLALLAWLGIGKQAAVFAGIATALSFWRLPVVFQRGGDKPPSVMRRYYAALFPFAAWGAVVSAIFLSGPFAFLAFMDPGLWFIGAVVAPGMLGGILTAYLNRHDDHGTGTKAFMNSVWGKVILGVPTMGISIWMFMYPISNDVVLVSEPNMIGNRVPGISADPHIITADGRWLPVYFKSPLHSIYSYSLEPQLTEADVIVDASGLDITVDDPSSLDGSLSLDMTKGGIKLKWRVSPGGLPKLRQALKDGVPGAEGAETSAERPLDEQHPNENNKQVLDEIILPMIQKQLADQLQGEAEGRGLTGRQITVEEVQDLVSRGVKIDIDKLRDDLWDVGVDLYEFSDTFGGFIVQ